MKKYIIFIAIFAISLIFAETSEGLFDETTNKKVFFIPQFSDFQAISQEDIYYLKDVLKRAEKENVRAVIFEMDTPGGRVDISYKYLSILNKSKVPTIAYLNPNGISAGMIIALGADRIAIHPNGLIGDAMPIQMGLNGIKPILEKRITEKEDNKDKVDKEKDLKKEEGKEKTDKKEENKNLDKILKKIDEIKESDLSEEEKAIANQKFLTVFFKNLEVQSKKNNRPVRVIRAMADPYQKLTKEKDNYEHSKKSPLTLSAKEAKALNVVDIIADDKEDVCKQLGLADCELVVIKKTPKEQIINFLSTSAISGILIMIGILGIYIEVRSPGFGVPGILGVTALTLFFWGHIGAGHSDWGPAVMFFVGLILILLEVFVVPGFGLVGILGIASILFALFSAFGMENIETAVSVVGSALFASVALMIILTVYILPKTTLFKKLVLKESESKEEGYSSHNKKEDIIGLEATVYSTLRPSGSIILDNKKRHDAMTEGEFIEKGSKVTITRINGSQVVVEKV